MMMVLDYYYDPSPDWRFCEKCRCQPAKWVWMAGSEAEMGVYCSRCLPPRGVAHRYLPAENGYIELYNKQRQQGARSNRR